MKQYPIWNIITACIYKSAKSYGVRNTGEVEIRVGTSSSNSHKFLQHTTTHRLLDNGDREYRFYLDGECIRRALLKKGADQLQNLEPKNHQKERGKTHTERCGFIFLPPSTFLVLSSGRGAKVQRIAEATISFPLQESCLRRRRKWIEAICW